MASINIYLFVAIAVFVAIFFGVFSMIFFFPLKNLHTYVRNETRSAMAAFVISLLLILGACPRIG
jgi:hypothetical protein